MPRVWKKSSSGPSFSRATLKCMAARSKISSSVCSCVFINRTVRNSADGLPFLRQIRKRVRALHKLPQSRFDCRLHEQLTEKVDLLLQLMIWNWLDKPLGRNRGTAIEFAELRGSRPRNRQRLTFRDDLTYQSHRLGFSCVKTAAGEQKIP